MGFKQKEKTLCVFVKNQEEYQWYMLNKEGEHIPIYNQKFSGYLQGLRLKPSKPKGSYKQIDKLHLFFLSVEDKCIYDIISGVHTYFAKKILYALPLIPVKYLCKYEIIIEVSGGELSIVWPEVFYQCPSKDGGLQQIKIKIPQKTSLNNGEEKTVDDLPPFGQKWDYTSYINKIKSRINQSIEMLPDDDAVQDEGFQEFLPSSIENADHLLSGENYVTNPETGEVTFLGTSGEQTENNTQEDPLSSIPF